MGSADRGNDASNPTGKQVAESFISGFLTEDFFKEHWEKKPLLHKASAAGKSANQLPDAISVDDMADIIGSSGGSLKMFKRGEPSRLPTFMMAYLDGASMVVNQVDRLNKVVYDLCRYLGERFFNHVFAVVYLTPPGSQAVRLHNDDQDVFLFQVWGKKRWTVRNAPQLLPYTEEMLGKDSPVDPELIGPPEMEFTIEPHDILYIPRGYLHEAATGEDEPSLHITITMPTSDFCWGVQLIKHFDSRLQNDGLSLPRALGYASMQPSGLAGRDAINDEALDEKLKDIVSEWRGKLTAGSVLEAFENRMEKTNEGQQRQFDMKCEEKAEDEAKGPPKIKECRRVRLMPGITCQCAEGGEVAVFTRVQDDGRLEMEITKSASRIIRALTNKPQFVRDLPTNDPFERFCVLQLLLEQSVIQLFLKGPDEMPSSPDDVPLQ